MEFPHTPLKKKRKESTFLSDWINLIPTDLADDNDDTAYLSYNINVREIDVSFRTHASYSSHTLLTKLTLTNQQLKKKNINISFLT